MNNDATTIRPSALPKLDQCPRWQGEGGDGGIYAARGTAMDLAFRSAFISPGATLPSDIDEDTAAAISWAVATANILAGIHPVETREEKLKVEWEGIPGTADALCEGQGWSADLKSGMLGDYRAQQAVYALGFMDRFFVSEWTVHLIYCDQRTVQTLHYTYEEAENLVRRIKARVLQPGAPRVPNEYCGWCARRFNCPERLETVAWYLCEDPRELDLTNLPPEKLGPLLELTHEIAKDDGVHDELRKTAKIAIENGQPVPGWKVQSGRETSSVNALMLQTPLKGGKTVLELAGTAAVFGAVGKISGAKFEKLWQTAWGAHEKVPPGVIQTNHGDPFLTKDRSKKK